MSGTINVVCYKSVQNGAYQPAATGQSQKKYLQTNPGGGNPGLVEVTEEETTVNFGSLTDPGQMKLENLSTEYDVRYGPAEGSGFVPLGRLRKRVETNNQVTYDGGIAFIELLPGVDLVMQIEDPESSISGSGSDTPTARVQVSAEDR